MVYPWDATAYPCRLSIEITPALRNFLHVKFLSDILGPFIVKGTAKKQIVVFRKIVQFKSYERLESTAPSLFRSHDADWLSL